MKRFSSRYEKIRQLRSRHKDACKAVAAARNAERTAVEQRRHSAELRLQDSEREAGKLLAMGLTGAILNSVNSQIEQAGQQLRLETEALRKAEEKLAEALMDFRSARAELRIVEELIRKEHAEYRRDQLRNEEHLLQEQAAQTFYRNAELTLDEPS